MFASTRKAARRGCAVTALAALSTFPAVPAEAVPFGSPQEIAFSSDAQDGNFEIYATRAAARGILLPDGQVTPMPWVATEPLRLTDHPADDSGPAWSPFDVAAPDGQRLAFESNRDGDYEIYVMRPDGSGVTRVTSNSATDANPAWRDANQLAFQSTRSGDSEIFVVNADGTGERQLTRNGTDDVTPTWSPDGTRIAFASDRDGDFDLYVMNADGTGLRRLTNTAAMESEPTWFDYSPAGVERIAFSRDIGGNGEIFSMNADGTDQTRLTSSVGDDLAPAWSPNGLAVVFQSNRDGGFELYVMNPDGTGQTRLTSNPGDDADADWRNGTTQVDTFHVPVDPGDGSGPSTRTCTKRGTDGNDVLRGSSGADVLCGGAGRDRIKGLGGADVIHGGPGRDKLRGNRGNDVIIARDGLTDRVNGGRGSDRALRDYRDRVKSVELLK